MRLFRMKMTAISLLLCMLFLLAACGVVGKTNAPTSSGEPERTDVSTDADTSAEESETVPCELIFGTEQAYRVVYPARQKALVDVAAAIASAVPNAELQSDSTEETKFEILIGSTNREESQKAKELLKDKDIIITVMGTKLVIYASTDANYMEAVMYMEDICRGRETVRIPSNLDLWGTLDLISLKPSGKTVGTGKTTVDLRFTVNEPRSSAGIYIGNDRDGQGVLGFHGISLLAEGDQLMLYRADEDLTLIGERKISAVLYESTLTLRLEIDGSVLRAYYLDDCEGIVPWPEIEVPIEKSLVGDQIGHLVKAGETIQSEMTVTYQEATVLSEKTYTNAVYPNYADPDVMYHDGVYYLYATGSAAGYRVHTSTDLVNWTDAGIAAAYGSLYGIKKNYWAPDVEYIDGKFYMVVSCNEMLGLAVSDSPTGAFKATTDTPLYPKSIDGHLFVDDDGRVYLYFVSWQSTYGIYGVELDRTTMLPILGSERLIIRPTEAWEKDMGNVAEGPYMLKHNGIYYMTYSGSHYQSKKYAVGYATSSSPLGSYEKYALNPIMIGNAYICGTAHHCIVTRPDGEMRIVYHCHNSTEQVQVRKVCVDRIRFAPVKRGIDRLEVYGPTVTPQEYGE